MSSCRCPVIEKGTGSEEGKSDQIERLSLIRLNNNNVGWFPHKVHFKSQALAVCVIVLF